MNLTPELLADLRQKADDARESDGGTWALLHDEAGPRYIMDGVTPVAGMHTCSMEAARHMAMADPDTVIALLDRIEALEAKWEHPSEWRCDGCGAMERPSGRRPDRHDGCGGVWIRL